jgi:2-iminobutanoate/2-iminopropanoate deaminase
MSNSVVDSHGVHEPVGPYSHAITVPPNAEWLYISGQVSLDPDGRLVGRNDLSAQTKQIFANLKASLDAAGYGFPDVIKTTTFLTRSDDVAPYRELRMSHYREHFPSGIYPTSTLVVVRRLANEDFLLEIEAVAAKARLTAKGI